MYEICNINKRERESIWHLFILTVLTVLWTFCRMPFSSYTSKQELHTSYLTEVNIFIQLYISSDMYDDFKTVPYTSV